MTWGRAKAVVCTGQKRDMQWHLAWCRRRQEDAAVLVVRLLDSDISALTALVAQLRVTDTLVASANATGFEIQAILDEQGLVRSRIEERLVAAFGTATVQFGWSTFPEEGLTLELLVERARSSLPPPHAAKVPIRKRIIDRRAPRMASGTHVEAIDA